MLSRLRAACLLALIAVAAVSILPKNDLPETSFDETDAPTIQTILKIKAFSFQQYIPSSDTSVPVALARMAKPLIFSISAANTAQSSESSQLLKPFCALRC
jgi:hypothetical protein